MDLKEKRRKKHEYILIWFIKKRIYAIKYKTIHYQQKHLNAPFTKLKAYKNKASQKRRFISIDYIDIGWNRYLGAILFVPFSTV